MKETKTFQNLMNAFAGESQAVQRYNMYAKIAQKEGWANIGSIFAETAINEEQHAKEFYKMMCDMVGESKMPGFMRVDGTYPVAKKTTYDNLVYSANGESEEVDLYKTFAKEAKEEGLNLVSSKFLLISDVEKHHSNRYNKMSELLKLEQVINKEERVHWKCMKCGYIHTAKKAPLKCPICDHPSGFFEKYELNI